MDSRTTTHADIQQTDAEEKRNKVFQTHQQIEVPDVTWYKDPALRKLYLLMPILFLTASTNGYDGSLLNGLQTMDPWQDCRSKVFALNSEC